MDPDPAIDLLSKGLDPSKPKTHAALSESGNVSLYSVALRTPTTLETRKGEGTTVPHSFRMQSV
jgi:hypothetical protein